MERTDARGRSRPSWTKEIDRHKPAVRLPNFPIHQQSCQTDLPIHQQSCQRLSHRIENKRMSPSSAHPVARLPAKITPTKATKATKPSAKKKAQAKAASSAKPRGGTVGRIVSGLVELLSIGLHEAPRSQVAVLSGYPGADNAGFKKAVGEAKKAGLVEYPANTQNLRLSPEGLRSMPDNTVVPPQNNAEMLERLKQVLEKKKAPKKTSLVLDLLSDGEEHSLQSIAKYTDYPSHTTPGFKKFMGNISSLGFIERPVKGTNGTVLLGDIAFPYGRHNSNGAAFVEAADV